MSTDQPRPEEAHDEPQLWWDGWQCWHSSSKMNAAMYVAARYPLNLKALLDHANFQDNGITALYSACNNGIDECTKLLLAHPGIDVNAGDANHKPIITDVYSEVNATRMLLNHGGVIFTVVV